MCLFLIGNFNILFTEPSAPIIEDLRSTLDYGLNVSWKTDVNSRQETFQVVLRRNDTGLCYKIFFILITQILFLIIL